jgi:hypothetical protein
MISRADAYDTDVHKFITRQAVKFLIDRGIGGEAFRNEISGKENILALGAEHEDAAIFPDCFPRSYVDPSLQVDLRYLRHFYRPTDSRGYYFKPEERAFVEGYLIYYCNLDLNENSGFQENALLWGGISNSANSYVGEMP